MVYGTSKLSEVNVLATEGSWAWPTAVRSIFQPRGINLMVAENTHEFIKVLEQKRIHTTIIDMDSEKSGGLTTVRIIRTMHPLLPCLALSSRLEESLLGEALRLDVFSVIHKPVDMVILQEQLNRLFMKRYGSDIFA